MGTEKTKTPDEKILATLSDYQRTFKTAHGRRVLRTMMKECGFMEPSFIEGDPHGTTFNEGRRSAVLDICNKLKYDLRILEKQLVSDPEMDDDYIE